MTIGATTKDSIILELSDVYFPDQYTLTFRELCTLLDIPFHNYLSPTIGQHDLALIFNAMHSGAHIGRKNLAIIGRYLEEQLTICAMHALFEGYDVYLLKDLAKVRRIEHEHIFVARLSQSGAVQTTTRQLLCEWLVNEEAEAHRTLIEDYLARSAGD